CASVSAPFSTNSRGSQRSGQRRAVQLSSLGLIRRTRAFPQPSVLDITMLGLNSSKSIHNSANFSCSLGAGDSRSNADSPLPLHLPHRQLAGFGSESRP